MSAFGWPHPFDAAFVQDFDLVAAACGGDAGGLKRKQFLLELEESADVKAARLF